MKRRMQIQINNIIEVLSNWDDSVTDGENEARFVVALQAAIEENELEEIGDQFVLVLQQALGHLKEGG